MSYKLDQISLFTAINNEVCRQHPGLPAEPRLMNAVIAAADGLVKEFAKPIVKASSGMGLTAWLSSDDVGISSKYMAWVLSEDGFPEPEFAYPRDPDDFGRCLRMVRAIPGFEVDEKIDLMLEHGQKWQAFANNWHDWANAYDDPDDDGSAIYAEMQSAYGNKN
ncbi:hypothetical protein FVB43_20720 [Erwinia rhapontici]|uniref:hypothetical protein n=1 Tax=Erwinia rhapontici TaxID=55212 RepID=UPI0014386432|nr:hypothetical protein [Erwinia rhapontici]NKG32458.1 hypothetical protein [Erwinia rhapontici]